MLVILRIALSYVFKHLIARFKATDTGYLECRWYEAALPQEIIPYSIRELIRL